MMVNESFANFVQVSVATTLLMGMRNERETGNIRMIEELRIEFPQLMFWQYFFGFACLVGGIMDFAHAFCLFLMYLKVQARLLISKDSKP